MLYNLKFYVDDPKQEMECNNRSTCMQNEGVRRGYLDVSEYVLKEYSPAFKPQSSGHLASREVGESTPQVRPIDQDTTAFAITPLLLGRNQLARDELLHQDDDFRLEIRPKRRSLRPRSNSLRLFTYDDSLDRIVEESDNYNHSLGQDYDEESFSDRRQPPQFPPPQNQPEPSEEEDFYNEYTEILHKFYSPNSLDLTKEIPQMENQTQLRNLHDLLFSFVLEWERPSFIQAWKHLEGSFAEKRLSLRRGIEKTFARRIGSLSFNERRLKLVLYLAKKKQRRARKRPSAQLKRASDTRLRLKGKFVTKKQLCDQLGLPSVSGLTNQNIKELLAPS